MFLVDTNVISEARKGSRAKNRVQKFGGLLVRRFNRPLKKIAPRKECPDLTKRSGGNDARQKRLIDHPSDFATGKGDFLAIKLHHRIGERGEWAGQPSAVAEKHPTSINLHGQGIDKLHSAEFREVDPKLKTKP